MAKHDGLAFGHESEGAKAQDGVELQKLHRKHTFHAHTLHQLCDQPDERSIFPRVNLDHDHRGALLDGIKAVLDLAVGRVVLQHLFDLEAGGLHRLASSGLSFGHGV